MDKHTPGPWKEQYTGLTGGSNWTVASYSRNRGTELVAHIAASNEGYNENQANAKLIAAAPELLAACDMAFRELFNLSDAAHSSTYEQTLSVIQDAIKKAEAQ